MGLLQQASDTLGADTAARSPKVSLALQGGGSFGAFTWGVLDRLLDEGEVEFDAISGASAGAVNAVVFAAGMIDGRAKAEAGLARFWKRMSKSASFLPMTSLAPATMGAGFNVFAHSLSPHQFNPFDLNPLREALAGEIDFERLRAP